MSKLIKPIALDVGGNLIRILRSLAEFSALVVILSTGIAFVLLAWVIAAAYGLAPVPLWLPEGWMDAAVWVL